MEKVTANSGFQLVTEDSITRRQLILLERSNQLLILDDCGAGIRSSLLFAVLTGSASRIIRNGGAKKTKRKPIEEPTKRQLLDMGESNVPKLYVPSKPKLLEWGQILVALVDRGVEGFMGSYSLACGKESKLR